MYRQMMATTAPGTTHGTRIAARTIPRPRNAGVQEQRDRQREQHLAAGVHDHPAQRVPERLGKDLVRPRPRVVAQARARLAEARRSRLASVVLIPSAYSAG